MGRAQQVPERVRIMTREGEAFVTSVWRAGEFYVTPCVGPASSARLVEYIDRNWTHFEPCSVTHAPTGRMMVLLEGAEHVTSMSFALARLYAAELAARPGVLVADSGEPAGFYMVRELIEEASTAALVAHAKKTRGALARRAAASNEG